MKTTQIQINGREATLNFDRHARFRYGRHGGNLNALGIAGQDYFQSILLIWSALDEASRGLYPDPALLVDHIAENDDALYEQVFAAAGHWFEAKQS